MVKTFYFIFYNKNKNIFNIDYYFSVKQIITVLIFSYLSWITGNIYLKQLYFSQYNNLYLYLVLMFVLFVFMISIETLIFHVFSLILGGNSNYKIMYKSVILSYFPLIFFCPFVILSFQYTNIFLFVIYFWILILKISFTRQVNGLGIFKSLLIVLSPLLLIFLFFIFMSIVFLFIMLGLIL
jgi:hypothetical protein